MPLAALAADARPASLGEYIPGDAWVYIRSIPMPSRQFLAEPSARVWKAVQASGIDQEIFHLVSSNLPPQERDEFEKSWNMLLETVRGIDWHALLAGERVFAERFGGLLPEFFVLTRPAKESCPANVAGIAKLLRQISELAGENATFKQDTREGVSIWALETANAPVGLYLLSKDDVIGLVTGQRAAEDVAALLCGKSKQPSIEHNERFQAALREVPAAEFSVGYVDFAALFKILPQLPVMMRWSDEASPPGAAPVRKAFLAVVEEANIIDHIIATGHMEGGREIVNGFTKLRPEAANKPLYRILAERKPFENVHRFIPVEASGFSASTFIDLGILYRTVLDLIRTQATDGPALCDDWEKQQKEWDFIFEDDVFSWLGGELILISMPKAPYSQGGDGVLMVRVRDPEKAFKKIRAGLDRSAKFLESHGQIFTLQPPAILPKERFIRVMHPLILMAQCDPTIGVWEDWLIVGSHEQAVQKVLDTAEGKHDSILKNARFRAEGVAGSGPVFGASFTDLTNWGEELAQAFVGMGFATAMMPEAPETRPIRAVINSLARLGPVVAQLNYFSSRSTEERFEDGGFRRTSVTVYKTPATAEAQR